MPHDHRFIAFSIAMRAAKATLELLGATPRRYRGLAKQCEEAAVSAPSNLGEGSGRTGADRRYHYTVALGSAREAKCQLELLVGLGFVDEEGGRQAIELLDRTCALTWRLLQATR